MGSRNFHIRTEFLLPVYYVTLLYPFDLRKIVWSYTIVDIEMSFPITLYIDNSAYIQIFRISAFPYSFC